MTESGDPYLQPNGVLRNLRGIEDGHKLARVEARITRYRIARLLKDPIEGNFDAAHLQAIHRDIFAELYSWAGEFRTVDMRKDDTVFAPASDVRAHVDKVGAALAAASPGIGNDRNKLVDAVTDAFIGLNRAHPFREGNGRVMRVFLDQYADRHGYRLAWERLSGTQIVGNSILADSGLRAPLRSMIASVTTSGPSLTGAKMTGPRSRMRMD